MIAPAARLAEVPLVFTLWGWWFKPKPWQRKFFRDVPKTVARSIAIRDGFLGTPPFIPANNVPVVYPGVDTERFHPDLDGMGLRDELGIAHDAPVVAMVARFQRVKGHHTFQSLAEGIARQRPDTRFVVAGDNVFGVAADGRYRDQVLQKAKGNDVLRDRLQYIGFRHDVENVYAAADVVVCASDFESFGKANLEAMACGKPIVSSNRGGPAETVRHGETGYLIDPGDIAGFSQAVSRLLDDHSLRKSIGRDWARSRMRALLGRNRVRCLSPHFRRLAQAQFTVALQKNLAKVSPTVLLFRYSMCSPAKGIGLMPN